MGWLYMIELARPLHHARYYLGSTTDLEKRFNQHQTGQGSPMLRAATQQGIEFRIICSVGFPSEVEARHAEVKLKRWKCNAKALKWMQRQG